MIRTYRYKCPKCGATAEIKTDFPKDDDRPPKYPPTCQNEEKHHSNRVFIMESQ